MQYALISMVCIAPRTTRNESVAGRYRNEMPSPTCSGSRRPRRVWTTNAFGGTSTVFHRPNPVIRTCTAPEEVGWSTGRSGVGRRCRRDSRAGACAGAPPGPAGAGAPAAPGGGAGAADPDRRSCSSCSCLATTCSRYVLRVGALAITPVSCRLLLILGECAPQSWILWPPLPSITDPTTTKLTAREIY